MEQITHRIKEFLSSFQDLSLLVLRLVLAYGFFEPAMMKLKGFDGIVSWFGESLHLPFPWLNALMATATETAGVIFLVLGFMTRMISMPLMIVMLVAIGTVHWSHGFSAGDNGFEIPLYYMIMLFVLMSFGPGKYSLDETIFKKFCGSKKG